ncbi:MAG: serine dehydratase beta chain, partial [Pseudomonadales bacterium]
MAISAFELFSIGIGPSSSHTVGPMRAALYFAENLRNSGQLQRVARVKAEMFGSLGATGKGHGTRAAVLMGLEGEAPENIDITTMPERLDAIRSDSKLTLPGMHTIHFDYAGDLLFHRKKSLPYHPNGMVFTAFDDAQQVINAATYFSVGGGFVVDESAALENRIFEDQTTLPYPFTTGAELLALCAEHGKSISAIMLANEQVWRSEGETHDGLLHVWQVMQDCVKNGCQNDGILPGGLKVGRRAPTLYQQLINRPESALIDPLAITDWVTLYALA